MLTRLLDGRAHLPFPQQATAEAARDPPPVLYDQDGFTTQGLGGTTLASSWT